MGGYGNVLYCRTCGTGLARDNRLTQCAPCQKQALSLALGPSDLPASFWDTNLMREALASWHFGQVIRAYRHHPHHGPRPLSQELVADWLRLTQTQLSRAENGPPVKDLDKLTHWAQKLKIPARYLWFQLPGAVSHEAAGSETSQSSALSPAGTLPHLPTYAGPRSADDGSDAAAMQAFRTADLQVGGGHLYATVVNYLQTAVAPRLFGTVTGGPASFRGGQRPDRNGRAGWLTTPAAMSPPSSISAGRSISPRRR